MFVKTNRLSEPERLVLERWPLDPDNYTPGKTEILRHWHPVVVREAWRAMIDACGEETKRAVADGRAIVSHLGVSIIRPEVFLAVGDIVGSINRYTQQRVETGAFLRACLENDLLGSCARADAANGRRLPEIATLFNQNLPHGSWGSPAFVRDWLAGGVAEKLPTLQELAAAPYMWTASAALYAHERR